MDFQEKKGDEESSLQTRDCTLSLTVADLKKIIEQEECGHKIPHYTLSDCTFNGFAGKDECFFSVQLEVHCFKDGVEEIPLFTHKECIKEARTKDGGYFGYNREKFCFYTDKEGSYHLEIDMYLPFTSESRKNSLFIYPPTFSNLHFVIPEKDITCRINQGLGIKNTSESKGTLITGTLQPGEIQIYWMPKVEIEKSEDTKPLVNCSLYTRVICGEAHLQCRSQIKLEVFRGGIVSFRVNIKDARIMNVEGDDVRNFTITENDSVNEIILYFQKEVVESVTFDILYEKKLLTASMETDIPQIEPLSCERIIGFLTLYTKTNIEVELKQQEKLTPIDFNEIRDKFPVSSRTPVFCFTSLEFPYYLRINVIRHSDMPILICIADKGLLRTVVTKDGKIIHRLHLEVRNNSKQYLSVILPDESVCLSSFLDSAPVKPSRKENGAVLIPLLSQSDEEVHSLELVWIENGENFKRKGKLTIGNIKLDIPVSRFGWEVYLPELYRYKDFKGTVTAVSKFSFTLQVPKKEDFFVEQTEQTVSFEQSVSGKMSKKPLYTQYADAGNTESGFLPVKVDIPITGKKQLFEKIFIQDEKIRLFCSYKKKHFTKKKNEVTFYEGES